MIRKFALAAILAALASSPSLAQQSPTATQAAVNAAVDAKLAARPIAATQLIDTLKTGVTSPILALVNGTGTWDSYGVFHPGIKSGDVTASMLAPNAAHDNLGSAGGDLSGYFDNLLLNAVNVSAGAFGSASSIPAFTVDAKGRILSVVPAAVVAPAGTLSGDTIAPTVIKSSLSTLGTITTGTWNGTPILAAYLGTGAAATNVGTLGGDLTGTLPNPTIAANAVTSAKMAKAAAGTLRGNATGTGPSNVTDSSLTAYTDNEMGSSSVGYIPYRDSAKLLPLLPGAAGTVVTSNGAGVAPTYQAVPTPGTLVNVQTFTASGTYTRSAAATKGIVYSVGGGGAGGGAVATAASQLSIAGGGCGGALSVGFNYSLPSTASVVVGAAGVGASGAPGGSGGASSFNSVFSAAGGGGGLSSGTATTTAGTLGSNANSGLCSPAPASTGDTIDSAGAYGTNGIVGNGTILTIGIGASSPLLGFGAGGNGTFNNASSVAKTGVSGQPGYVIIYEYK